MQKIKMQYGGNEEQLRQLKEQEKLLKETEEKIKTLDTETSRMSFSFLQLTGRGRLGQVLGGVQRRVSESK